MELIWGSEIAGKLNPFSDELKNKFIELHRLDKHKYKIIFIDELNHEYHLDAYQLGQFDSWEIITETIARKSCDKSFFKYKGSAIPQEVIWFFDAEQVTIGDRLTVTLIYENSKYDARIQQTDNGTHQIRIFWDNTLSKKLEPYANDGKQHLFEFHKIGGKEFEVRLLDSKMENNEKMVQFNRNMILYGPPGTGKTYYSVIYAVAICEEKSIDDIKQAPYDEILQRYRELKNEGRIIFTTFHQSYSYEEFIEGIKPKLNNESDNLGYSIEDGVFKKFCNIAVDQNPKPCVFVIDEINRGNISKIFGELITLIEETKRAGKDEAMESSLPYSGDLFSVPDNVYILGTMNTADRSIALMDTALRRRFEFTEMMPDPEVLESLGIGTIEINETELNVAKMLQLINQRIEALFDREHTIGHAFFTKLADNSSMETLAEIFEKNVIPLLQEYFYEDYEKIQLVLGDNSKDDEYKFILDRELKGKDLFNGNSDVDLPEKVYTIQHDAFNKLESYKLIGKGL